MIITHYYIQVHGHLRATRRVASR